MLSPDPVKRSLNPYPYCDNDPVNYNDPTGEIPSIVAGGLLGGLFGGASGFLGSTISQVISGEKFNWRKALGAGANGLVVGAAKGARSGAAVSGLENIAEALGLTGRDPRSTCGSTDPFDLESGLGGSRGYHSQRGNRGGFSPGSFVKDTLIGAVAGGLGSAGFYGAGKAVEALRGSVVGRRHASERDIYTGVGYDAGDSPVRIDGKWIESDMKQALLGHSPRGLGSPDIHHGGQMPGGALHEIVPKEHRNNYVLHQNLYNQGVTSEMRMKDRQLHWWYRAREQGADQLLPDWIYD